MARLEQKLSEPEDEADIVDVTFLSGNVVGFGELARHASAELRGRFVAHLISIVLSAEHDQLDKLAAIDAAIEVAPALDTDEAQRLWTLLLPISEGELPPSAPGLISSHLNPKLARSRINREVTPEALRTHALHAVARLAPRLPNVTHEQAQTTASALASDDAQLASTALYVARELGVTVDATRLQELTRHGDRKVRALAAALTAS